MRYDFVHAWGGASLAAIATLSSYKSMEMSMSNSLLIGMCSK